MSFITVGHLLHLSVPFPLTPIIDIYKGDSLERHGGIVLNDRLIYTRQDNLRHKIKRLINKL